MTTKKRIICKCGYSDYLVSIPKFQYICERCGRIYDVDGECISDIIPSMY
jgi:hypothetical protein